MNDVTGMPQTAVVLGGTSDLALAVLRLLAARRLRAVVLGGRDQSGLAAAAKELSDLGVERVETARFEALDTEGYEAFAERAMERLGSIDLLLVAIGLLGTGELDALNPDEVAHSIGTNFTGPAAGAIAFTQLMRNQGYGRVVVFSSVAGVRVRRSNFVYGAAKAGLDGFCQGLADALRGSGVDVMIVRPGFVRTKMTAGLAPAPFAVSADQVATAVVHGLEQGVSLIWVPRVLAYVFGVLRFLPQRLWRLLPG